MKDIIIEYSPHEIRVATLEGDALTELYHERPQERRLVGNIYKGRVAKVLPGMESAFVDIGEERSAFFYIDDILPESLESDVTKASDGKIPIDQLLSEGQDVIVQVSKGPISTKGARITSHISLPGRNLVYMPFSNTVGVSRQITDDAERVRLRDIVSRLRPQNAGFIIRTVAEGRSEEDLHSDINFLVSLWDGVLQRAERSSAPSLLHTDLNVVYRTLRDSLSKEVRKLVVNEREEYRQIRQFVKSYLPKFYSLIEYYGAPQPIFDHFGVENEIERALGHKVWLPSGGSLIIDQTEALTAIDVNTGRFVGKESHEQTILRTNLEAVEEIVHQLQLRNIGGIIIIDLIDMEQPQHRQEVYQVLKDQLRNDKARSKILQISEMGLVEMTRKRDRESLMRYLCDPCPYCAGSGHIKSVNTVLAEIFRELKRVCQDKRRGSVTVYVHPDIEMSMREDEHFNLKEIEEAVGVPLSMKASNALHHEQYEIYDY
ncbi:MAG: Rne/Rng family ribonuclease [bacterium]